MAKYILKDYKSPEFFALNSHSTTYRLTFVKISFWGLRRRTVTIERTVPDHVNLKKVHDKWDRMIESGEPTAEI